MGIGISVQTLDANQCNVIPSKGQVYLQLQVYLQADLYQMYNFDHRHCVSVCTLYAAGPMDRPQKV